ncbi:MAG: permease [Desulfopila sp.]|nr:permease [Desulfopila sp.]
MSFEQIVNTGRESLEFFVFAMVELTVLFIGISFLVGVINEFLPQEKVKGLLSAKRGRGYFMGAILGGLTPFCSCSTIPMMVGLLKAGAGFGPTMSFLFASPLVNPVLIGLFLTLMGTKITVIYSLMALSLAILSGYILQKAGFARYLKEETLHGGGGCGCADSKQPEKQLQSIGSIAAFSAVSSPAHATAGGCCEVPAASETNRWKRIFEEAVKQFRAFLPFILLGVAIGSVIHGFMPADLVAQLAGKDNPMAIPVSAVIGIPLYIRASTMLPIAASLVAKGMSFGAVIALIVGGAGASLPEVTMLKGLFRAPLLAAFLAAVFFMAITTGFVMNFVL